MLTNFFTHKDDAKIAVEKFNSAKHLYERTVESIKMYAFSLFENREEVLDEAICLYKKILQIQDVPVDFYKQIEIQLSKQQIKRISFSKDNTIRYDSPNKENSEVWEYIFAATGPMEDKKLTALATTFGIVSTGVAISSLAASTAILSTVTRGVSLMSRAVLGLMGPVGWGIAGISIISGGLFQRSKNDKIIAEYKKMTNEYLYHANLLKSKEDEINELFEETTYNLRRLKEYSSIYFSQNYSSYTEKEKLDFSKMVSIILSSLIHLNKAVV